MRKLPLYALAMVAIVVFCLWYYLLSQKSGTELQVSFLSIGQGDSTYIQAPNGRQMLIDGGPRGSLVKVLKTEMPPGDTSIDVVLLTHPDADHYAGLVDLLNTYSVGTIIESGKTSTAKTYQELEKLIAEKRISKVIARTGTTITLDQDNIVVFKVLFPSGDVSNLPTNDASIVGRLTYGATSVMFTGDAPVATEKILIAGQKPEDLASTILKVGHHGSRTSSSSAFLKIVQPEYAIISAGKGNRYGHPHQEVVDLLKSLGITVLITKDEGTITFFSDGIIFRHKESSK